MDNNFTPEQIEQFLEQFFNVVGRRQYIGARYVPIFGRKDEDTIEWDNTAPYEPLTIVLYQGNSFTSRTYVPTGIEITDTAYWANTGNYNAQVEQYRAEAQRAVDSVNDIKDVLPYTAFDEENTVKQNLDAISNKIIDKSRIYTLEDFEGDTNEDKLITALSTVYVGTILCGEINVTEKITLSNFNYQQLIILGGKFTINVPEWIDHSHALWKTVPIFSNCTFEAVQDNTYIYANTTDLVCPSFINCVFENIGVFNNSAQYVQSFTATHCRFWRVKNLITAFRVYHLAIISCLIEASDSGVFLEFSTNTINKNIESALIQGCTIEGRKDSFLKFRESQNLVIESCYFEGLGAPAVVQTLSGASQVQCTFRNNNLLFDTFLDANNDRVPYVVQYSVDNSTELYIYENDIISASNQNITNVFPINPGTYINYYNNVQGSSGVRNRGFTTSKRTQTPRSNPQTPTFNSGDSSWICTFYDRADNSKNLARPIYLFFVGSFLGSGDYRGVAIIRIDRYVAQGETLYATATVLHAMNTTNATPSSNTVSATVTVSTGTTISAQSPRLDVKVFGFTQFYGRCRFVDPFYLVMPETLPSDSEI